MATACSARLARIALVILVAACSHDRSAQSAEPPAKRRQIDPAPRQLETTSALPERTAVASFAFDTGGDQMTLSRMEAGLEVVVRYRTKEWRQTIASCAEPSGGSALGGGTERELEVALCDGELWLIAEPGKVVVERKDEPNARTITTTSLPWPDVRAHRPTSP